MRILFLAANPKETDPLELNKEYDAIADEIHAAPEGRNFDIPIKHATSIEDLQNLFLKLQPDIVHFSGHGRDDGSLILEDRQGHMEEVPPAALTDLFRIINNGSKKIRCVILNTCYSETQANAISKHVECVIGTSCELSDSAAQKFAVGFYLGLGHGKDIKSAFDLGCNRIDFARLGESQKPKLLCKDGVDPSRVTLLAENDDSVHTLFDVSDTSRISLDETAQQLKDKITSALDSEKLMGDQRDMVREIFVSLDMTLDHYKDAMRRYRASLITSDQLQQKEIALRMSIEEAKDVLMQIRNIKTSGNSVSVDALTSQLTSHDSDEEIKKYQERISANPDDDSAYNALGNYYFSLGKYEEAKNQYKLAISKNSAKYIYYSNIGDAYRQLGKWSDSITWYKKALELEHNDAVIYNNLGVAYSAIQDYDKAIENYKKALSLNPVAIYYMNIGDVYVKQQKLGEAIPFYETAILIEPDNSEAHALLGGAYSKLYQQDPSRNVDLLNKAIDHLIIAIKNDQKNAIAHAWLGDCYFFITKWSDAVSCYRKAVELNSNDSISYARLGFCYQNKGDLASAGESFSKAKFLDPENPLILAYLGDYYRISSKWDDAISHYEKVLSMNKNDVETMNGLGLIYYYKGDYDSAIKYYDEAIKLKNVGVFYYNKGLAYQKLNKLDDAISLFKEAIRLDEKSYASHMQLGLAYLDKGLLAQALGCFEKASSINPSDPESYSNVAFVYTRLRNWDKAIEFAKLANQKAKQLDSSDNSYEDVISGVYHYKGLYEYNNGLLAEAIDDYKLSLSIAKHESDVTYYNLYLCYYSLGNYADAKTSLLKAIAINADNKYYDALRNLERVGNN